MAGEQALIRGPGPGPVCATAKKISDLALVGLIFRLRVARGRPAEKAALAPKTPVFIG